MINKCCERHWRTVTNAGIFGAVGEASNPGPVQTRQAWRADSWLGVCTGLSDSVSMAAHEADAACCSRLTLSCTNGSSSSLVVPVTRRKTRRVVEVIDHTSGRIFGRRVSSPPQQWEARGARTDGKLPTTVPASPGVLFVAGLLREVGPTQRETDAEFTSSSRPAEFPQVTGVIDALEQDLEGSCEVERTVAPADLSQPGFSTNPPGNGPVRAQNRFTPLDVEADAISAFSRPEEFDTEVGTQWGRAGRIARNEEGEGGG